MGGAGTPSGRFDRAIQTRNPLAALSAASELPHLPLERALQLVLLLRATRHERYQRAASRWIERWLNETPDATIGEVRELSQALVHLDDRLTLNRLATIVTVHHQRQLERVISSWAIQLQGENRGAYRRST